MIQTAGIGALALIVGMILTRKDVILQKFCVPSPVTGGLIFSAITLILYGWFDIEISFNDTLKNIFMLAFFTCVGFECDLKVLKQGGRILVIMLVLLVIIIAMQNIIPLGITRVLSVEPLIGMAAGSVSMTGGHGTVGGFTSVFQGMGLAGAGTIRSWCHPQRHGQHECRLLQIPIHSQTLPYSADSRCHVHRPDQYRHDYHVPSFTLRGTDRRFSSTARRGKSTLLRPFLPKCPTATPPGASSGPDDCVTPPHFEGV